MTEVKPAQQIRLKPELWEEIDKQASIEERSRNKMVEILIRRGLSCVVPSVKVEANQKVAFGGISYDPTKIKL